MAFWDAFIGPASRPSRRARAILRFAPALCAAALAACSTLPPARTVGASAPASSGPAASSAGSRENSAEAPPGQGAPPGAAREPPAGGSAEAGAERGGASGSRAASDVLLARSRAEMQAGSYDAAAASIERALRISPDDPSLWLELAEIKLAAGDPEQAGLMARKAVSLAGGDPTVAARAERLIDAAGR